jgi:hypothetical protein
MRILGLYRLGAFFRRHAQSFLFLAANISLCRW